MTRRQWPVDPTLVFFPIASMDAIGKQTSMPDSPVRMEEVPQRSLLHCRSVGCHMTQPWRLYHWKEAA